MAKERMVLDLEEGLKDAFQARLKKVNLKWKMTGVLRLVIYRMLMMENEELRTFMQLSMVDGSGYEQYQRQVEAGRAKALLPEGYEPIHARIAEAYHVFSTWETGSLDDAGLRKEMTRIWESAVKESPEYMVELMRQMQGPSLRRGNEPEKE